MAENESAYKDTIILPATEFPMRGNLAKREPELLAKWAEIGLQSRIAAARANGPRFVLHDGPPYANGHIHYGHILNKVLKDLVVKYQTMTGKHAPYVPGWDCHGLPIELAVERELGGDKLATMSKLEVRAECHKAAMKWVDIQRTEFKRLGVFGEWDEPYLTLRPQYEAAIVRAIAAFASGGSLYRGKKPVHWCITDQTALAEAEIEHQDHTSPSIYVRMTLESDGELLDERLAGKPVSLVIWTTTPWTLPANLAVVLQPSYEYVAIPSGRADGEHLLVAKARAKAFLEACKLPVDESTWIDLQRANVEKLEGQRYRHPFIPTPRADADFRVWFADHVTLDAGTGLVHTAPGHGADDYKVGQEHKLDTYAPVNDAGQFTSDAPAAWVGLKVFQANPKIIAHLVELGALLSDPKDNIRHSYPHCWRCKNPVVFRATPQWFISLEQHHLRQRALEEIDKTRFIPPWGRNRIFGMIEHRPDWCLSRQRAWGVPLPVFYCTECDHSLVDAAVMDHVAKLFAVEGADAWFRREAKDLIPEETSCEGCGASTFRKEQAIVDVWFESGVSWFAVCDPRADMHTPVDLYLEGSDQHRGWFHSSLLAGIGVAGRAPYKAVLTHGFVMDEHGNPYSKSEIEKRKKEGKKIDYIPPDEVIGVQGAELLRLWVSSVEFRSDMSYSRTILNQLGESYRKYRNTCRFVLGNLHDFEPAKHAVPRAELTGLDAWAMARLDDFIARVRKAYDDYEFHVVFRAIVDYVTVDLSAFYLDVTKDRVYCDARDSRSRRAAQTVLFHMAQALATLAAPILAFTAEDVWAHLPAVPGAPESVHLALMPEGQALDAEGELAKKWTTLLDYRARVLAALEPFRAAKHAPLDARVTVKPAAADRALLAASLAELPDLFVVSAVVLDAADAAGEAEVTVDHAPGTRCGRCWKWHEAGGEVDPRCAKVLSEMKKAG
jgi:isoleucyl-tRNA synthetase